MKKLLIALILFPSLTFAAGLTLPQGGLGTTTVPTNYVVIGLNANRVTAVATSSLGITGTTYTATYPITLSGGNAFGIAFGTTTANVWALLQTFVSGFISQASSTIAVLHLGTPLEVASGGTASTTLTSFLVGNGTGAIQSGIASSPLVFSGVTLSCPTCSTATSPATSTNPLMATYFVATSTTVASQFPLASTTGLTNTGSTWLTTITNAILGTDGNGKIISTTTPTALVFNATQTGATSTFAGNVRVVGNLQVDGNFFAPVNIVSSGNATINGTLTVTGAGTFNSTLSAGTTTVTNLIVTNTSTSTSNGGFNIASGCYAIAGNCLVSSTIPSGTTGQMLYYAANGTTLTATSTLQINSTGNIIATGAIATSSGGITNNMGLGRLAAIYATSTPGANNAIVFTGARDSSPSFSAGTLTLPSNTTYFSVEVWGAGGGGGSGGTDVNAGNNGTAGGQSCFGTNATACTSPSASANGGALGAGGFNGTNGGAGGAGVTGDFLMTSGDGSNGASFEVAAGSVIAGVGGTGGGTSRGGGGGVGGAATNSAGSGGHGPGGGGGGGGSLTSVPSYSAGGGSGGAGGYAQKIVTNRGSQYFYTNGAVGVGGGAPSGATSGGGNGAPGGIVITVYTF